MQPAKWDSTGLSCSKTSFKIVHTIRLAWRHREHFAKSVVGGCSQPQHAVQSTLYGYGFSLLCMGSSGGASLGLLSAKL